MAKRDVKTLEQRRLKAGRLLAKGVHQAEVARRLAVSRQSVSRWSAQVEADEPLRRRPLGRPGSMNEEQRRELITALKAGALAHGYPTELWTLQRVAALIKQRFGLSFSTVHVWRILGSLGWSCQRPTGRAVQRNERAIREWKAKRWPALKKTPLAKDAQSSS